MGTPFLGPQEMALSVPGPHTHDFPAGTHVPLGSLFKCAAFCSRFPTKRHYVEVAADTPSAATSSMWRAM